MQQHHNRKDEMRAQRDRVNLLPRTRRLLPIARSISAIAAIVVAGAFAVTGSSAIMPSASGGHAVAPASAKAASAAKPTDPVADASANPGILAPPDAIVGEADGVVNFVVRLADDGPEHGLCQLLDSQQHRRCGQLVQRRLQGLIRDAQLRSR